MSNLDWLEWYRLLFGRFASRWIFWKRKNPRIAGLHIRKYQIHDMGVYLHCLVVWLPSIWHFPINIGFLIIPIDEVIFFRGVAKNHQPVQFEGKIYRRHTWWQSRRHSNSFQWWSESETGLVLDRCIGHRHFRKNFVYCSYTMLSTRFRSTFSTR